MGRISKVTLPDNTPYDIGVSTGAEYVRGTWTAATNKWTGVTKDMQLYDGKEIVLYLPFAGTTTATTLNLTLNGGSGPTTGEKAVYFNSTSRHTTHYGQYQMVRMVYHASHNIAGTNYEGWWMDYARDTNDTAHNTYYYYSSIKAHSIIYRYQVCVQMQDGSLLPIASVDNKYNDTAKVLTTESFLPTGLITYYNSSGNTAAGSVVQAGRLYDSGLWDLRYSFNEGSTLTANTPVYMVTLSQGNGLVKLDADPIAQALPSTDDGKLYIYLGGAYDTYRIHAYRGVHPVFWYKNGGIRPYPETGIHIVSPGSTNQLLQSNGSAEPEWSDSIYIDSMNTGSLIVRGNSSFVSPINGDISGNAATASSVAWGDVTGKPSTFAPSSHTHDDRYYTEAEIDQKLTGVATSGHTHAAGDIVSGKLPVNRGGTGLDTLTSGQVLVGNGTDAVTLRPIDTTSGGTNNSTSLITSGAVYSGLAGKANSSHNHNASDINAGTLSPARGGTGESSLTNAANALINALGTGSSTPTDNDYYVSQYAGGGTTTTTFHRRPVSALWTYMKGKADSVYVKKAGDTLTGGLTFSKDSSAFNSKGVLFSGGSRIGENNEGALGVYGYNKIYIRPGNTGSSANTEGIEITTSGLIPSNNNSETLGDSSHVWSNVYATTFNGTLSGNASSSTTSGAITPIALTNENFNDLKPDNTTYYYGAGSNSTTNGPTNATGGFGMVIYRNAQGYRTQEVTLLTGQKFYRVWNNSSWGTWYSYYTTNHKPSKADVGLGNVENKSSATIRSELTSSNVTTALGYTPLNKAGDTMTGSLTLKADQYWEYNSGKVYGLNANNSDIYGLNGLYFKDAVDSVGEGINFYRDATHWDSLRANSGKLQFNPNRTNEAAGTWYDIYHTNNKPSKADVGLGNVDNKSSATIRSELTSSNVTEALGYTPADSDAYLPLTGGELTGDLSFSQSNTTLREIRWKIGGSDYARIAGGATASNSGYLELATADDANEPIYIRQYTGVFATLKRTATLLDSSGNTSFPGTLSVTGAITSNSTVTATRFDGNIYTNHVVLQDHQRGTSDIAMFPVVDRVRANRLAFLPADQIIIENTVDGGETWTDAGYSDAQKAAIFATSGTINIPRLNNAKSELCGVRITITGMKYDVPAGTAETEKYNYWNSSYVKSTERYFQFERAWFWVSANNDTIGVTVQSASGANSNSWTTRFDNSNFTMTGWSGSDWVKLSSQTFGGGTTQTGNHWNWRFTFYSRMADGKTAFQSTTVQSISVIKGYGASVWNYQNQLMYHDHIYSYDASQNVTFPANITTTGTIQSEKLIVKGTTVSTNTYADTNPKIAFMANDGQHGSLTWTSYDAVQSPASLTLNGNQGDEYFIAPNIKATGSFHGALSGNATSATESQKLVRQTKITTTDAMDAFNEASKLKWTTFKFDTDPGFAMGSNDGMLISVPWESANYGMQIAMDDNYNRIAIRTKNSSSGWRTWSTLIHSDNYTTYAVPKTRKVNNKELSADISLTASDVGAAASGHNHDSVYLKLTGGSISDSITASKAGEIGFIAENTSQSHKVEFIVGSSGNGGIYDRTKTKWVVYSDTSGNVTLNGNANTATTATTATNVSTTAGSANAARHVWFSDSGYETRRNHDDDFKYNPSTNTLTVGTVVGALTGHASEDLPLAGGQMTGNITWKDSTALPQFSGAPTYLLGIEAFTSGGATKWAAATAVKVGEATKATQDGSGNTITSTYKTVASLKSKGGQYQPIYFDSSGNAQNTTYTLNKSVPNNAIFTDELVKQNKSTSTKWRNLMLGSVENAAANTAVADTAAAAVYKAQDISAQPSTGTIRALHFSVASECTLTYNATQNCLQFNFA